MKGKKTFINESNQKHTQKVNLSNNLVSLNLNHKRLEVKLWELNGEVKFTLIRNYMYICIIINIHT